MLIKCNLDSFIILVTITVHQYESRFRTVRQFNKKIKRSGYEVTLYGSKHIIVSPQAKVIYLEVFQLDLQVPFVVHVSLGQEDSVVVVSSLAQHLNGNLYIKVDFTLTALSGTRHQKHI